MPRTRAHECPRCRRTFRRDRSYQCPYHERERLKPFLKAVEPNDAPEPSMERFPADDFRWIWAKTNPYTPFDVDSRDARWASDGQYSSFIDHTWATGSGPSLLALGYFGGTDQPAVHLSEPRGIYYIAIDVYPLEWENLLYLSMEFDVYADETWDNWIGGSYQQHLGDYWPDRPRTYLEVAAPQRIEYWVDMERFGSPPFSMDPYLVVRPPTGVNARFKGYADLVQLVPVGDLGERPAA